MKPIVLLVVLALSLVVSRRAAAAPKEVFVEVSGAEDELSRATNARLVSELKAAGFSTTTTGEARADVRASVVIREGRPAVYMELSDGRTLALRADDVSAADAPGVLALRAAERLRALLSSDPGQAVEPPAAPAQDEGPGARAGPFASWHASAGARLAIDRGAVSVAPSLALGLGIGGPAFVRVSFTGPSSVDTERTARGAASVSTMAGRAELGLAHALSSRTTVAGALGAGIIHYRLSGEAATGFVATSETQTSALLSLDGIVAQRLWGLLHVAACVGASLAAPALGVKIAGERVAQRGLPELHAQLGVLVAF